MADKEISELTAATTPLGGDEIVHIVQDGDSRKVALTDVVAISTGAMLKATYDPNDDGVIAVAQGGTGGATASAARTGLGLGTMAVQGAGAVAITGGTVTGITDLAVADGGTGGSDASTARTNLGLVIGTDVQAYSANLAGFASTTVTNVQNRVNHTGTQLAATISDFSTASDLRIAAAVDVTVQAYSATLDDWSAIDTADKLDASVIPAAEDGKILSWTGTSLVNKTAGDLGTFVVGEDVQAYSANLDDWSALATSAKQDADPNLTALSDGDKLGTSGLAVLAAENTAGLTTALAGAVADSTLPAFGATSPSAAKIGYTNQNGSDYVARALENVIGEGKTRLRDALGDGVTPSATDWTTALQKSHDDLKTTTGEIHFAEEITLNDSIWWDGYVSLVGNQAAITQRFAEPEPHTGAVIMASAALDLGQYDDSNGTAPTFYEFANGLINVKLDTTLLDGTYGAGTSTSRPRASIRFEKFGMLGNGMTVGSAIRNIGTMRVHCKMLDIAHFPDWGIQTGSRHGVSPGSSNGCTLEDIFVTSCGGNDSQAATTGGGILWQSHDGYMGKVQTGGNVGVGILYLLAGNISTHQIQSWNNEEDNVRFDQSFNVDFNGSVYDGDKTNIAILGTTAEMIRLSGNIWHANRKAQTAARDSSNIYVEAAVNKLFIDANVRGDTAGVRYGNYTAWAATTSVAAGSYRVNANKRYFTTAGGTTGSTAPTHTSGSVSDGGVTWTFQNGYSLYGLYDEASLAAGGSIGISDGATFSEHRTADMRTSRANMTGKGARITTAASSGSPISLFRASDPAGVWEVMCKRPTTTDMVRATVIGSATTPVIVGKTTNGTVLDLAVSSTDIQVSSTTVGAATIAASWRRISQ